MGEHKAEQVRIGSKIVVRVHLADGEVVDLGGKRAERAQAAIVTRWDGWKTGVFGLRATMARAIGEAHSLVTPRIKYGERTRPAAEAVAVPVRQLDEPREDEQPEPEPTCWTCDGVGHGYPGAPPCSVGQVDYSGDPWWSL